MVSENDGSDQPTKPYPGPWKVVTDGNPLEVWAIGFWDKGKAERLIAEGYFHRHMYEADRGKRLIVVEQRG